MGTNKFIRQLVGGYIYINELMYDGVVSLQEDSVHIVHIQNVAIRPT